MYRIFLKSKTFAGTNPCYVSMSAGEIPVVEPAWGSVLVANADAGNHDWKNSSRYDKSRDLSVTTRRTDTVFDEVHRRRRWYFGGTKIATQIVSNSTFWPSVWLRRYLFFDMTITILIKKFQIGRSHFGSRCWSHLVVCAVDLVHIRVLSFYVHKITITHL